MTIASFAPRLRPLSPHKRAVLSVLDVGTTKITCLVARLDPVEPGEALPGRTHKARVLGLGIQRSQGLKGGVVADMAAAERAIRLAVDAAERMAGVRVEGVVVSVTGGRLGARRSRAEVPVPARAVGEGDMRRAADAALDRVVPGGRLGLHALPVAWSLDDQRGVSDPRGMVGERLGVEIAVAGADAAAARNLMLAVERCHLDVEAAVATPYASGLSVLVDDEAEMGTAVIDLGGGTTSVAVFAGGRLVHLDAVAVGGHHVTMDVARGLSMRLSDAERLKTLHGSCYEGAGDEHEPLTIAHVGEDERDGTATIPRAALTRIVRPRVEEVLELVRDRLRGAGLADTAGRRLVLTGGASQLAGLPDLARRLVSKQVRVGRPVGVRGLPDVAKTPGFAAAVGLLVYPQVAGQELRASGGAAPAQDSDGYLSRVGRWLKDSF